MRYNYKIVRFPSETKGYNLTAYTEGSLQVMLGPTVFLEAGDILLVELAVVLHKWLLSLENSPCDLYYSSMDYEEEPILALRFDPDRHLFIPESVWAKASSSPIAFLDAKKAASSYLSSLRSEIERRCGADLAKTLDAAVKDDG